MRVGIIGTGRHGSRYAEHVVNDSNVLELRAIARRSSEGRVQAKRWGCRWFNDWRDLVAWPEVDAVIAVVPPNLNYAIAARCAKRGKPLLVEKPLAIDAGSAAELVRVMATSDTPLTVAHTLRYNPVIGRLRDELRDQGPVYTCYAHQRLEISPLSWLDTPEVAGGGVELHVAVHIFDALRFITGVPIARVVASARVVHNRLLQDMVSICAEMENGGRCLIDVSKVGAGRSGRFEFVCQDGQLFGDQVHGEVGRIDRHGKRLLDRYAAVPTIVPLLRDWTRFVSGDGPNPVSGEDGLYAVLVADACRASWQTGQWVPVRFDSGRSADGGNDSGYPGDS